MGTERKVRLQPALSAQTMPVWRDKPTDKSADTGPTTESP